MLSIFPVSQRSLTYLKTSLADLAHGFADTTVDSKGFLWQRNHFEVAHGLKRNSDILLTIQEKGSGFVILNRTDYTTKIANILDGTTKFLKLGDLSLDDTHKLEIKLQKRFLELFKKKIISREVYNPSHWLSETKNVWITKNPSATYFVHVSLHTQHVLVKWFI